MSQKIGSPGAPAGVLGVYASESCPGPAPQHKSAPQSNLTAECCPVSQRIETFSDGTWQPAEDGFDAFLLPARAFDDSIQDVVAWAAGKPASWWLRWGVATHLGEYWLRRTSWYEEPICLVETPERWLRDHAGRALCILDWKADLRAILNRAPLVIFESAALRRRVDRILAQQVRPLFRAAVAQ